MKNKGLITTLVVVGLGVSAYFLFLRKKDNGNGGGASTSDLDFLSMANKIFDAMDGYGTGNTTIETELKKLKSRADWDALVQAYGTRTVSSGTGNIFQSDFTGTLPEALNDELDSSELQRANEILNKIGASI